MKFELFSRINNYPVTNKGQFDEAFQAFFERQYIVYFTQAIQRSASKEEKDNLQQNINTVKEIIFEKHYRPIIA